MDDEQEGAVQRAWVVLTASPMLPVPFQLEQGMTQLPPAQPHILKGGPLHGSTPKEIIFKNSI